MTAPLIALALAALAVTCFGLVVSLLHLRRRHRALRRALTRVARERDEARWAIGQAAAPGIGGAS